VEVSVFSGEAGNSLVTVFGIVLRARSRIIIFASHVWHSLFSAMMSGCRRPCRNADCVRVGSEPVLAIGAGLQDLIVSKGVPFMCIWKFVNNLIKTTLLLAFSVCNSNYELQH
jgi:hypothetical protein